MLRLVPCVRLDVSGRSGRVARTKNVVLGSDASEETWRALDERVNTYPTKRSFKAIGVGGEGFAASMRSAVEGVVGHVREENVSLRPSSAGKYISVTVGPVLVESGDQVRSIYTAMREDERLKFFI
ncbi:hypothetical protein WJX81_005451 [Elliptochloris bilobata]|uniref:DUF493 domain-containing protein n=1 Tax=Elliptochloris bilobata TaxID=381761 RepID=A0AAW1RPJ0_9CHLO